MNAQHPQIDARRTPLTPPHLDRLVVEWAATDDDDLLRSVLTGPVQGDVAVGTSFGAESAVLLDMVARIDRHTPVIFVDTGRLFAETLAYRDLLVDRLRLEDVRTVSATTAELDRADPELMLYASDPDGCCAARKVEPYLQAIDGFQVLVNGRKRHHGGARRHLRPVQRVGRKIHVDPLAGWDAARIDAAYDDRGLPRHPLVAAGYDSIGCTVCTRHRRPGETPRAGRWAHSDKTECGIHGAPRTNTAAPAEGP